MAPRAQASVILVGELPEQLTGSGCCGKLVGDNTHFEGGVFAERAAVQARLGELHTALEDAVGERAEILLVDPRNQVYLVPRLVRDALRYRPGPGAALRAIGMVFGLPAVIINGAVVASGRVPSYAEIAEHLPDKALGPDTPVSSA